MTNEFTSELSKIMADIAAEIEAKKAYRKALKTVRAMRKAGKSAREIFAWANAVCIGGVIYDSRRTL
jgi:hypothetical protein